MVMLFKDAPLLGVDISYQFKGTEIYLQFVMYLDRIHYPLSLMRI